MNELFESTGLLVTFIVQLLMLIIFLRLAWNVGKIRKQVVRTDIEGIYMEACKLEYIGKKQEALETFLEFAYMVKKSDMESDQRKSYITKVTKKVEALGGTVPNLK